MLSSDIGPAVIISCSGSAVRSRYSFISLGSAYATLELTFALPSMIVLWCCWRTWQMDKGKRKECWCSMKRLHVG